MSSWATERTAEPLTRNVSSKPGMRNNSPAWPVARMFSKESRRLSPEVRTSRSPDAVAFTKPGGPPLGEASRLCALSEVARMTKGESSTKLRQWTSRKGICFLTARGCGARYSCRSGPGIRSSWCLPREEGRRLMTSDTRCRQAKRGSATPDDDMRAAVSTERMGCKPQPCRPRSALGEHDSFERLPVFDRT